MKKELKLPIAFGRTQSLTRAKHCVLEKKAEAKAECLFYQRS